MFSICFPDLPVRQNKTDYFFEFPNGSEIWIAGLDDKERTEKILGKEYSTIYFNECSQIQYGSIHVALTRLAEKSGLVNKAWYDENPPSKRHWSYHQFILGRDPETYDEINTKNFAHLLMNPEDNRENIADDYIESVLRELPEKQRARFLRGEFTDEDSGLIYYAFSREKNLSEVKRDENLPVMIGCDFNVNPMTAVAFQYVNRTIRVFDEFFIMGSNTDELALEIKARYGPGLTVIPDSTGKRVQSSSSGLSDHEILRRHGFIIPAVQNPFRIDRYNAVNKLFGDARLVIDKGCIKLTKDVETLAYKENTTLPDTSADSTLGHLVDGLGYAVWYYEPLMAPLASPGVINRNF